MLSHIGIQNGNPFDGSKTYKVVLPKDFHAARFWSFTVYGNQFRSVLQIPQVYPQAGSQSYPSPAAAVDSNGSATIYAQSCGVYRIVCFAGTRLAQRLGQHAGGVLR